MLSNSEMLQSLSEERRFSPALQVDEDLYAGEENRNPFFTDCMFQHVAAQQQNARLTDCLIHQINKR
jgi:hypothetical protein